MNRPENPVKFLSDHFRSISNPENRNRISQAVETILLSNYGKPVFERNLLSAFDVLSNAKEVSVSGIGGTVFQEFVTELIASYCVGQQIEAKSVCLEQVQKRLVVREHEVVPFSIFRSAVYLCLISIDFCTFCDQLFTELDVHKQDRISCKLADSILNELFKGATEVDAETETLRLLAVAAKFTNKKIAEILEQAMDSSHSTVKTLTQTEFVSQAINIFFAQITFTL
ncbi:tubulin polyglutamylase complex subunit 1-like isoform X2 [Symsagittifera roscoffensis]